MDQQQAAKTEGLPPEPRGFGEHVRGLAGEYAHEQGWGLNEAERTALPETPQDTDGGKDYEYGARDFGDEPINTARIAGDAERSAKDLNSRETGTAGGGHPHDGPQNYGIETNNPTSNETHGGGAPRQSPEAANTTPKVTPETEV